jgi:hypothetical protein
MLGTCHHNLRFRKYVNNSASGFFKRFHFLNPLTGRSLAFGLALVVGGISAFILVVGVPYSDVSVTTCPADTACIHVLQTFSTQFVPISLAIIPLLIATMVGLGLIINKLFLSWIGTIALVAFSLITGFSIGVFFMPFAIGLVAILATNRRKL